MPRSRGSGRKPCKCWLIGALDRSCGRETVKVRTTLRIDQSLFVLNDFVRNLVFVFIA